jgi:uncharacterized protein YdhG (YjbR/CyaY superfamily)
MATTDFRSVDEYIAAQPKNVQVVLRRVRGIIRKAVPSATEAISYQMPTFKIAGGMFLCLGGWKQHYSLYPASDALPSRMIERIAKFQAREVSRRAKAKRRRRKKDIEWRKSS